MTYDPQAMVSLDQSAATITELTRALEAADIPFALGDPVAMFPFAGSRVSSNLDVYVFEPSDEPLAALQALGAFDERFMALEARRSVRETGQARAERDGLSVDVFFQDIPFLETAEARTRDVHFRGMKLRVLASEDLTIAKALFNRRKDWKDIEQLLYVQGRAFDHAYARNWLIEMVGNADQRVLELDLLVTQVEQWELSRHR